MVGVYQPHRYSRTEALGANFARSFVGLDHLVLTDIYPSGESPRDGITGRIVYDAVVAACPDLSVTWQTTLDDVVDYLEEFLRPGDLCLTLGAGDLTTVPDRLIERRWSWLDAVQPGLASTAIHFNEPLGARTTYRVGGIATALAEVGSLVDLQTLVAAARDASAELLPVGLGSNLLVADTGFQGVAIVLEGQFADISIDGTTVVVGAAVSLPRVARATVAAGLTGFEWAVGVPGTIGGAVTMNAGGHGSDIAASLVEARVLDLQSGAVHLRSLADLEFDYRRSSIISSEVVLDARLTLDRGDRSAGEDTLSEIVRWRRENQPGGQNAGSVFTNPPGDSAGRLIDAAGGRGLRVGTASVSTKHANFIQADPGGNSHDIVLLMRRVADLVFAATGVRLEPETRLVGFDDDD